MSLLLDALKKAAQQKAEKSKQEAARTATSDDTDIDTEARDISALEKDANVGRQQAQIESPDETEIDLSELEARIEKTHSARAADEDTRLDSSDSTQTEVPQLSEQMQTGEDETIIFSDDDVSDLTDQSRPRGGTQRAAEDETDLSQLAKGELRTGIGDEAQSSVAMRATEEAAREDETDINLPFESDEKTDSRNQVSTGEDTNLSQLAPADETEIMDRTAGRDDTGLGAQTEDETDISIPPPSVADLERAAAQRAAAEQEDDGDEDLSLLLVDRDQTNLTSPTSITDPRRPDQINPLQAENPADDELALVDTTRHQMPRDDISRTDITESSATATTGIAQDTQTTSATMTATETSTRTYAPDNYDRTLMRLPSDDASRLFAGMKSDSDVVMTPEYAKKVFRSKSSAQRMQHYKVYSGIAIAILLAIGIYGAFQYQEESNNIDTSLRPLKRDPMPGLIKQAGGEKGPDLFADTKAQGEPVRTIELVKNAGDIGEDVVVEEDVVTESTAPVATTTESVVVAQQADASPASSAETLDQQAQGTNTGIGSLASSASSGTVARASSSTLQISSSSRVDEKGRWLREAYTAYQAGNNDLAMSLYNKVLEMDPGNRNALLARAAINVQNNNSRAAIRDYQTILLANPTDSLAMASMISVANFSPAETESQLKLMIRDEPDSPYLNFALANIYGAQKRWQEAQRLYFKALQNNPGDPNYAYNLAVSLEHIAQPGAAMTYYQRALDNFDNGLATFSREVVDQRLEILAKL